MEGIEASRRMFASCWFDEVRCKDGLNALANYAWDINEETNTFSQTPIHNWASNGADAFRQFAQGFKTKTERKPLPKPDTRYIA
jgi:phage terminase large subunit